ncbi:phospholipid phosphatase homolog 1.2 homolog isoform X4 [Dendroctonus ponderosae]|uniref:phospholipid phosphatase homolog 1.2 homolog isoform X4 n=1 Tax=Dendroctonus ponderosae TaxID=77166 RepID=UPI0020362416|nr:phospholipid phosphatase homolog 1.2 homolog isoform X4 [Dendroctonus ponderosae]
MMNNGFTPRGEFYVSTDSMCFDNKAMVAPMPSGGTAPQPGVRINIPDLEKNNPSSPAPSRLKFRKRVRLPHALNVLLSFLVLSIIILLELGFIPATNTGFYCKDSSLSFKFTGDTISATTLLVSNLLVVPLLVLFLSEYLRNRSASNICLREVWYYYKEFLIGCGLALVLTEVAKAIVGEHRPHFFDVCRPNSAENCTEGQYVSTYQCTVTNYSHYFMADTSRSFPSGHSSLSVFVAVFCSYLIQVRLVTVLTGVIFKYFFISCLMTWSLVCSLTRITDKRHHWWDVAVGMLLGVLVAFYSISIIRKQLHRNSIPRVATSTTTLIDVKNKDAKSEII